MEQRIRWGDAVEPGFVRLSVGCEPVEKLWNALKTSLDACACCSTRSGAISRVSSSCGAPSSMICADSVTTNQPPGGGVMLIEMLNILENFDLAAMGHNTPDYIATVSEAMKIATVDKDALVGDPDFVDVILSCNSPISVPKVG